MGDFGMSQLQWTGTVQINQKSEETKQKKYQESLLRSNLAYDVRTNTAYYPDSVHCDQRDWKKLQEKAGTLDFIMPTGVAIGSPVQREPAVDPKIEKDRKKTLAKIKKKGCVNAELESVVLQEKVSQSLAFRNERAKQRRKEEKKVKDKDKTLLDKEDAKQNLIRAFSNNIRTDRSGKPIISKGKDGKPDEKDENFKALKSNEAFKNNLEGHMSQVVQWVYQVDLDPNKMLTDAYIQNHGSELFQTAERLRTFFDYYKLMGNEEWERGFLNDGAIVGEKGKNILAIKEEQAKNFLDVLSNRFKTVLSVDVETGEFLTEDKRNAIAANVNETKEVSDKRAELSQQRKSEELYYRQMVEYDLNNFGRRDLPERNQDLREELFEENEKNAKRYRNLNKMFRRGGSEFLNCWELARSLNEQVNRDKESSYKVYENLEKYLRLDYSNQRVLGKKPQEIVNQRIEELQRERKQLNIMLNSCEETLVFIAKGGKISSPTTLNRLLDAGYREDDLLWRVYRSKGGIVDQSDKILKKSKVKNKEDEKKLVEQFSMVQGGKSYDKMTDEERSRALQEVRSRVRSEAAIQLFEGEVSETARQLAEKRSRFNFDRSYAGDMRIFVGRVTDKGSTAKEFAYQPVNVDNVLTKKENGTLEKDSDGNFVGEGMAQATLDYVNYLDSKTVCDGWSALKYFKRMKELIGDAKVFEVKNEEREVDKELTNRKFTAFLLQDYINRYVANTVLGVKKHAEYTEKQKQQLEIFEMITSSLKDIAKKDTTGENYEEGSTMQKALDAYRSIADKVSRQL